MQQALQMLSNLQPDRQWPRAAQLPSSQMKLILEDWDAPYCIFYCLERKLTLFQPRLVAKPYIGKKKIMFLGPHAHYRVQHTDTFAASSRLQINVLHVVHPRYVGSCFAVPKIGQQPEASLGQHCPTAHQKMQCLEMWRNCRSTSVLARKGFWRFSSPTSHP